MIQKITLSLLTCSALAMIATTTATMAASNAELERSLNELRTEFKTYKNAKTTTQESASEEVLESDPKSTDSESVDSENTDDEAIFESFSDLGLAASKVYHIDSGLSIGGYGEIRAKKFNDFKNFSNETNNRTRNKLETNIVRFIPYFGYKFNDWIIMNVEIEFEDGGARSDGTNNYKYVILEFAYLDFMLHENYNLRVGNVLVPMGNINLNHEPVAFLTSERPLVETLIIPSTWATNGALLHGEYDGFEYYTGIVGSPDAGRFREGRFMQLGRLGARQFTNDFSGVARLDYNAIPGVEIGGSGVYGRSSVLEQERPGAIVNTREEADVSIFMAEMHASYKNNGWDIQAVAVMGGMGDEYQKLNHNNEIISGAVNGQYLTVGYDVLNTVDTAHKLYVVGEIERLDMDADDETTNPENHKFNEYTFGLAYFPDPKVVIKAEYNIRDYGSTSQLADEQAFITTLGFIF